MGQNLNTPNNADFARVAEVDGTIPAATIAAYGDQVKPLADGYGRLIVNSTPNYDPTYPVLHQVTTGSSAAISQVTISAQQSRLIVIAGYNSDTANALFVQLHNKASAISNGDVPLIIIPVPASQPFSYSIPLVFSVGIVAAISSTEFLYTATAKLASVAAIYSAGS
jgi:hypothetical protein